jgi:YHS domain-containing protein
MYENEAQYIRPGEKVNLTYPYQNRTFEGTVSTVLPIFDPVSRTLKMRLEVNNPDFALRPEMFMDVELPVKLPPTITVPVDAVLDSGLKKTVFVARGQGFFEPRQVETGWRLGEKVEILKGLTPGEQIVVSGNFLIDSESRMKLAAAGMHGNVRQDPICGRNVDESKARVSGLSVEQGGKTYYFFSEPCKQKFVQKQTSSPGPQAETPMAPAAAVAPAKTAPPEPLTAKDPICGMTIDRLKAGQDGLKSEYQGVAYYFCCPGCKQKFDQNPGAYLGKEVQSQTGAPPSCLQPSPAAAEAMPAPGPGAAAPQGPPGQPLGSRATTPGPPGAPAPASPSAGPPPTGGIAGGQAPPAQHHPGPYKDIRNRYKRGVPHQPPNLPPVPNQPRQAGLGLPEGGQAQARPLAGNQGEPPGSLVKAGDIPVSLVVPPRPVTFKDPVCGMELGVDRLPAVSKSEYQGKTYFFCSGRCKQEFDKNPAGYAAQTEGAPAPAPRAAAQAASRGGQARD